MASLPPTLRYPPYNEDDGLGDGTYELVLAAYRFRAIPLQPRPLHRVGDISFFDWNHAVFFMKSNFIPKLEWLIMNTMRDPQSHHADSVSHRGSTEKYQIHLDSLNSACPVKSFILAENLFQGYQAMLVVSFEGPTNGQDKEKMGAIIVARVNNDVFLQHRMKSHGGNPSVKRVETLHENLVKTGGIRFYEDGTQRGYCEDIYIKGTEKHKNAYNMLRQLNNLLNKHQKVALLKYPAEEECALMDLGTYPEKESVQTEVQTDSQTEVQTDVQTNVQTNVQSDVHKNFQMEVQGDVQTDVPTNALNGMNGEEGQEQREYSEIPSTDKTYRADTGKSEVQGRRSRWTFLFQNMTA